MRKACVLERHNQKPITMVCTNPYCKKNRLLCMKCLSLTHSECVKHVVEIEDLYERSFEKAQNWISDASTQEAIHLIHANKLSNDGQIMEMIEKMYEQEFGKLVEEFMQRIKEAKEKIIQDMKEKFPKTNLSVDRFKKSLESVYNFDQFLGILETFENGQKSSKVTSEELDSFFATVNDREKKGQEALSQMAKSLTRLVRDLPEELKENPFKEFKKRLPFDVFDGYSVLKVINFINNINDPFGQPMSFGSAPVNNLWGGHNPGDPRRVDFNPASQPPMKPNKPNAFAVPSDKKPSGGDLFG